MLSTWSLSIVLLLPVQYSLLKEYACQNGHGEDTLCMYCITVVIRVQYTGLKSLMICARDLSPETIHPSYSKDYIIVRKAYASPSRPPAMGKGSTGCSPFLPVPLLSSLLLWLKN